MKMRGTATEKLADVIQMLLLVKRTGMLTVQRENSRLLEEGSLFIQSGQIADARVENLRGADALKKLNTWTKCYFVFQEMSAATASPFAPLDSTMPEYAQQSRALLPGTGFAVIPARTAQFQSRLPDFEALGVSRTHRQLFLLADGQRSVEVLAKLLGRRPQEVLLLLGDLENLDLLRRL